MNRIDLEGRFAVITGGAAGIGLATAQRMAASGARVALWDRDQAAGQQAVATLPGEGQDPDEAKVAQFYAQYGADPKQFLADMHSFSTDAKLKRATQYLMRERVGGTPTVLVNGKYMVTTRKSYEDIARVTDALVARERAAR